MSKSRMYAVNMRLRLAHTVVLLLCLVAPTTSSSWAVFNTAGEVTTSNWKFGESGSAGSDTKIPSEDKGVTFSTLVRRRLRARAKRLCKNQQSSRMNPLNRF